MQTATGQPVNKTAQDRVSDSESINKFKNLFKKEDGMSEPDLNNSSATGGNDGEMFDLSALHKRNERHRQIQASRSGIYDEVEDNDRLISTQRVKPGRFSNLKERPSPQGRLNTEGNDNSAKRGKISQMKLNPNFMKQGMNADVVISPRTGILSKRRDSTGENSDKEPKVRLQEETTPAEIYNKK